MTTEASFGVWLKQKRIALDLTQQELADQVGCSVVTIRKFESSERRPSKQLAGNLAQTLHIPPNERSAFIKFARAEPGGDSFPTSNQLKASPWLLSNRDPVPASRQSLPLQSNLFIGRNSELREIEAHLNEPSCRLLTLVGWGGVGKSRLALEIARRTQARFRDGVWFVSLAGVENPANLSTAVAVALGLTFAGPLEPKQQLIRQLQDRQMLLLLDNFEQLLPKGAETISSLIQNVPGITMLITSRERLRLQAEITVPITGLSLELARALFVERAQRTGSAQMVDQKEDKTAIDQICRLVGGLPLAVEMAAAWVRLLSPSEILADLEQSLDLLTNDLNDLPERHRSIQAVFASSWSRLSAEEQMLLAGLSIFIGSFTRDAAQFICDATLPQLAGLHDHSLIQRDKDRFRLHELIRQFAGQKVAETPDHQAAVQERHAYYYIGFLSQLTGLLKTGGKGLIGSHQAIDQALDNIQTAWQWAVDNQQPHHLLPAMLALQLYLDRRGQVVEGVQMMSALIDCVANVRSAGTANAALLQRTQAMALLGEGALGMRQGKFEVERVQEQLKQALELLENLDAPDERVAIISLLGPLAMMSEESTSAQKSIEDTLALARKESHFWGEALALNFLGLLFFSRGQFSQAKETLTEAVTLWQKQPGLAYCKGRSMVHLGLTHHALGDYQAAQSIQEEALRLAQEVRDYSFVPLSHCNLAFHYYAQGKLAQAKVGFLAGLAEAQRLSLLNSVWHSIVGLGLVAAADGLSERAATLLSFGIAQPGAYNRFLLGEPQRVLTQLQAKLSPKEFEAAQKKAQSMDLSNLNAWLHR